LKRDGEDGPAGAPAGPSSRPHPRHLVVEENRRAFLRRVLLGLGALAAPWFVHAPWVAAHERGPSDAPDLNTSKYRALLDELQREHGFHPTALASLFAKARLRPEIVGLFEDPPERLPLEQYHHRIVTPGLTRRGVGYLRERRGLFQTIEASYGVDPAVITAIVGVETHFGRRPNSGYRVFDALNTVFSSVDRREAFARRELIQFLVLCREEQWGPLDIKGSYAGAMGTPQFVPSSYRNYAVDYDGDGRRDLWRSDGDIAASVANFLNVHGWRAGEKIRLPVRVDSDQERMRELLDRGLDARVRLKELPDLGGEWSVDPHPSELEQEVSLLAYSWENRQRTVAVLSNFRTLLQYNRSVNYVLVVADLAEFYGGLAPGA
jgi:membrane-bound lytic murein transglycosylase B